MPETPRLNRFLQSFWAISTPSFFHREIYSKARGSSSFSRAFYDYNHHSSVFSQSNLTYLREVDCIQPTQDLQTDAPHRAVITMLKWTFNGVGIRVHLNSQHKPPLDVFRHNPNRLNAKSDSRRRVLGNSKASFSIVTEKPFIDFHCSLQYLHFHVIFMTFSLH